MEVDRSWDVPRDALFEQLSSLLHEMEEQEVGNITKVDLLDHLDGTRRAIDRLAATITDKYTSPSSVEFFSPAVTRPLSTGTDISNSSSENSFVSDSHLTQLSSPTTLISDYDDDIHHRSRLLDEDEDILIGRAQLLHADDDDDSEEPAQEDQDERFERLSLLLTSVLKEANEAIRDYETIREEPAEVDFDKDEPISRCSSRLSTAPSTLAESVDFSPVERRLKAPGYAIHSLHSQETIRPMIQPPTAPPTPPPTADSSLLLASPDSLSTSSLTSSLETIKPIIQLADATEEEASETQLVLRTEVPSRGPGSDDFFLDSPKELSLEYLLGDYLNEIILDVRRSEFVGARFWIFLMTVMGMWSWMFVTNWVGNLTRSCLCRN